MTSIDNGSAARWFLPLRAKRSRNRMRERATQNERKGG